MGKEFTFENVARVAQAFSDYLNKERGPKSAARVAIGYDFRKDSENFARLFAEVLVGNGIETLLAKEACPTPAVSFKIVDQKYDAGIVITPSHNPPGYNGVKIKTSFGSSADKN